MTIAIIILFIVLIWQSICMRGLSKRAGALEKSLPADIEQARHEGWNEGREYQIALDQRRHPRDPKTKQFVKR